MQVQNARVTNTGGMTTQPWLLDAPSQPPRRTWTPMLLTQLVVILAVLVAGVTGAALRRIDLNNGLESTVRPPAQPRAARPGLAPLPPAPPPTRRGFSTSRRRSRPPSRTSRSSSRRTIAPWANGA